VPPQNNRTMQFIEAQRSANVNELNAQLTMFNNTLDLEKRRNDELNQMLKMNQAQHWWACPIDGMNKDEL
ncbi:agamous-like mads-box protein agl62-like, partial [Trifolium pratense]